MPKQIVSLFSGCGGLDLGFTGGFIFQGREYERLDTTIVFANDFDQDAANCYNANPLLTADGASCLLQDIRTVDSNEIPNFNILLAGFPCQPFSNAGNRKGINDINGRGTLFEECERIIKAKINTGHRPQAFVFENVRGILSSKMSNGVTTVPQEISNRMHDMGYEMSMKLVCASDYGVPQQRYRVIIILLLGSILQGVHGIQDDVVWEYSETTQRSVDLIGGCKHGMQAIEFFAPGFKKENLPAVVFEGRSWKDIPYELLSPRFKKIADDPKRYHAPKFFRRFAFGEINGTITASAQPENCGITHPVENRRYSVRECARIQSFPDNYSFGSIPIQSQYKVIGNAVPPVLGWVIARALLNYLPE